MEGRGGHAGSGKDPMKPKHTGNRDANPWGHTAPLPADPFEEFSNKSANTTQKDPVAPGTPPPG